MPQNGFRINGDYHFENNLSRRSQRQLRLIHIFKRAALLMYNDVKKNKLKLLCFVSFPTTTTCATVAYVSLGLTKNAKNFKDKLSKSVKEPVQYGLYADFMNASFDGRFDFDRRAFFKHNVVQKRYKMMQSLSKIVDKYPNGWLKSSTQKRLRKYTTKGELTLVN